MTVWRQAKPNDYVILSAALEKHPRVRRQPAQRCQLPFKGADRSLISTCGLKLSKLILAKLEEDARLHGLKSMKLETGTLQPEALGLFAKWGFTRCGPYADYPTDDPYSVFMEKPVE